MPMEITNNDSSYVISMVELKTSTPGVTRTEQIKTGYKNVNDYSWYLQEKYSYMNTGTTSMQGVPITVSVSSAFLKKCMNDPDGKIAKEAGKETDEYTVSAAGTDIKTVTQNVIAASLDASAPAAAGFDIRA